MSTSTETSVDMQNLTDQQQRVKADLSRRFVEVSTNYLMWVDGHRDGLSDGEIESLLYHVAGEDMADLWVDYLEEVCDDEREDDVEDDDTPDEE